jgi:nitrogen fixation-related uncharacterized protein
VPRRRLRLLLLVAVALVAATVAVVAVFGGSDTTRYETADFSFEHPSEWEILEGVEFPLAEQEGREEVGENTIGLDLENWVTVYAAPLEAEITGENIDALLPTYRELYERNVEFNGGRILREPYVTRAAGLPAIRLRVALRSPRGAMVQDELTQLFDGRTSYVVNCQNEPDREIEMAAGCAQIFASFRPSP